MEDIKRIGAGVMFESDVLSFIDHLAAEQRCSRSFMINLIIRQYARQQDRTVVPSSHRAKDSVIRF